MHIELIKGKKYLIVNYSTLEIYIGKYLTTISDYGDIYIVVERNKEVIKLGYDTDLNNIGIYNKSHLSSTLIQQLLNTGFKLK